MKKKQKLGRPPLIDRNQLRDRVINFRLTEKEQEALKLYCWRYEMSEAEAIRECMRILSVIPDRF